VPESHETGQPIVDAAAVETIDGLSAARIEFIVLKGAALARMLYLREEDRGYIDFDVLVSPGDREKAAVVLGGLGFAHQPELAGDADFLGLTHSQEWGRSDGAIVDLHWRLFGTKVPPASLWATLRRQTAELELHRRRVRILAPPASALHLAIHAAQSGPLGPKALADLDRGLELWPFEVWKSASRIADELLAADVFAAGLRLRPEGEALARQLQLPATPELDWLILNGGSRPRGTFHLRRLGEARGWRAKGAVLRRALLPSEAWISRLDPSVDRGRLRLGVAYAGHILVRAPVWTLKSWIFLRRARRAARSSRS
jgi:hypothetical protein